jgi:hypothetical protein
MARNQAYVWWNAGICHVVTYPDQECICMSKYFRRATRKARNLGYDVRVYCSYTSKAPPDAVQVSSGSYVLPGVR